MSEADRVEQAYRRHWARLLALLTSELRDLDLAEESLQDAFTAAVSAWPPVPDNPPAWLLTTARRRAFDRLRRTAVAARKAPLLIVEEPDRHEVPDDLLRLIFTCCHPALAPEARVALTLRCVAGLTTRQIARLFLVGEATMAARITRAKKKISQAGIPYRVPSGPELAERRDGVLAVIYLIFTEGYAAAEGDALIRDAPADEAIALARMLAGLMPADHEVRALLALMLLHHARRAGWTCSPGWRPSCRATICCPPPAPSCCAAWADWRRPWPRTIGRWSWWPPYPSGSSCSAAGRRPGMNT
ncbi:sigma-70 family RNA polymerase sigma factor [Nonomuraea sp. NPDC046570]|uniref:RNA polymerase sigma factor n=1 Tax=Nonomuraea sp. NPDC046570 TaxID=3155255 RepID=UPI0033E43117